MSILSAISHKGNRIEWVDRMIGSGTMKDVYFSPDKKYVVAFYRKGLDAKSKDRLNSIVGIYRDKIIHGPNGDYWTNLICWPSDIVEYRGLPGIVMPTYQRQFFFQHGSVNDDMLGIKGKEKNGKWFASAKNQNRFLHDAEKGDLLS
jgi:hypothetical protein